MSTAPVKSIIDEQIEEVAGRTLADAQELAREVAVRLLLPYAAQAEFEADMEMF